MYPQGYTTGDEDDTADYLDGRGKVTNHENMNNSTYDSRDEDDDAPWRSYLRNIKQTNHMGDMADWTLSQMDWDDPDWDEDDIRPKVPEGFWKMKDGKLVKITKMTDSHLANSIALCQRKGMYCLAQPLIEERQRRAEFMDMVMEKRDPLYAAFTAGWNAGSKSASDEAYPDVGFSMPTTKKDAWNEYKKSIQVDNIKRMP